MLAPLENTTKAVDVALAVPVADPLTENMRKPCPVSVATPLTLAKADSMAFARLFTLAKADTLADASRIQVSADSHIAESSENTKESRSPN
jgi:hypothetical protein